jgi:hypothetical protein
MVSWNSALSIFYFLVKVVMVPLCYVQAREFSQTHHHTHLSMEQIVHLEKLSEAYWFGQRDERASFSNWDDSFKRIQANYACLMGVIPLGSNSSSGIQDGHKFACGLHIINGPPIVYSYGSNKNQDFELAILELRPDSKIYIFEIDANSMIPTNERDSRITYLNRGLSYQGGRKLVEGSYDYV